MTKIKTRQPPCVDFGVFKIYCDRFKASAKTTLTEIPSVTSSPVMSGKCRHSTHIFITGRICNEEKPMFIAGVVNNMHGSGGITIKYRDLQFEGCTICGYTAEDSGEDFITVTIELATLSIVRFLEEVSS